MMFFNAVFITVLYAVLLMIIIWSYFNLSSEKYQFLAAVPKYKKNEKWVAVNYTYYGFISASSSAFGVTVFYVLMLLPGYSLVMIAAVILPLFAVSAAAAKLLAAAIEKKKNIISVGAALFTGFVSAPLIVFLVNRFMSPEYGKPVEYVYFLTAASISFLFAEGTGRLACVSFGCCYGKPVKSLKGLAKSVFSAFYIRFYGTTKKIAYASGLEGKKIIPVQVITSAVYVTIGSASMFLLLKGYLAISFLISSLSIFIWRFLSEFLRSDYRGGRRISVYQIFTVMLTVFTVVIAVYYGIFSSMKTEVFQLKPVLIRLWDPAFILAIQGLWCFCFVYMGKSTVTGSKIKFFVKENMI